MKFFRAKKKGTLVISEKDEKETTSAIDKQKITIEQFNKRILFLSASVKKCEVEARECIKRGDQRGARYALQRKKINDDEISKLTGLRLTLENQVHTMELYKLQQEGVISLQRGVEVQRNTQSHIDISSLDAMVNEMQEQKDMQYEISQLLTSNLQYDSEEDIDKELERLGNEQLLDAQETLTKAKFAPTNTLVDPLNTPYKTTTQAAPPTVITQTNSDTDEELLKDLLGDLSRA